MTDTTTTPAPVVDLVVEGLAALEAAEWTADDRLRAHPWGLVNDCECGCGSSSAVTARLNPNAAHIADLAAWATTNLPAALAEIVALRNDLAAKNSDFEAAMAALDRDGDRAGKLAAVRSIATGWVMQSPITVPYSEQQIADGRAILAFLADDAFGGE